MAMPSPKPPLIGSSRRRPWTVRWLPPATRRQVVRAGWERDWPRPKQARSDLVLPCHVPAGCQAPRRRASAIRRAALAWRFWLGARIVSIGPRARRGCRLRQSSTAVCPPADFQLAVSGLLARRGCLAGPKHGEVVRLGAASFARRFLWTYSRTVVASFSPPCRSACSRGRTAGTIATK